MQSFPDGWNLEGKVAVLVGGAGYLLSTLGRAMSRAGMKVVILDVAWPPRPSGSDSRFYEMSLRCDGTSKGELKRARDRVVRRFGRVDVLLNGAGVNAPTPFLRISDSEIQRILRVNLIGPFVSCQVFGEVMLRQRRGSIVNFASVSSGPPLSKAFVYSVAKAGVVNLTQNLAREWARFHVRVNALKPGFFPTAWSMKHFIDRKRQAEILGHTPMGRFGRPEELVGAVLWLASDASSFVTGSAVTVDGGFTAMTI